MSVTTVPSGTTSSSYNEPTCVEFIGTSGATGTPHIELGTFYDDALLLGKNAAIDGYAYMSGAGWMLSGSTGGAHPWLWGCSSLGPDGQILIGGQVYLSDGSAGPGTWSTIGGPRPYEWFHFARVICIDGGGRLWALDYWNGLLQLEVLLDGTGLLERKSVPAGAGSGPLWWGHSDHQGGQGRLAVARIFERNNGVVPQPLGAFPRDNFVPKRVLGNKWGTARCAWGAEFRGDRGTFPDISDGYDQANGGATPKYKHTAIKGNGLGDAYPFPVSYYDQYCPYGKSGDLVIPNAASGGSYTPTANSAPSGARTYDNFIRSGGQQDYVRQASSGPDLGSTVSAGTSQGAKAWSQNRLAGGPWTVPVLGRGAAIQYPGNYALLRQYEGQPVICHHDTGTADHIVQVRRADGSQMKFTDAVGRYVDSSNFISVFSTADAHPAGGIKLYEYVAGANVSAWYFGPPANTTWTEMLLWIKGAVAKVYVNNSGGVTVAGVSEHFGGATAKWEQVGPDYAITSVTAGTRVGTCNDGGSGVDGNGIYNVREIASYATP